jgi:hypothetical protein
MNENTITQTTSLPHGYRATFTWSPAGGLTVEWEPDVPHLRSPRAQRKFRDAYNAARRAFMTDVATSIGGSALILDIDGPSEVVRPASRH